MPIRGLTSGHDYLCRAFKLTPTATDASLGIYVSGLLDHRHPEVAFGASYLLHTGVGNQIDIGVISCLEELGHEPQ